MQRGVSGLWWSGRFSVRRRTRPISSTVNVVKLARHSGSAPDSRRDLTTLPLSLRGSASTTVIRRGTL